MNLNYNFTFTFISVGLITFDESEIINLNISSDDVVLKSVLLSGRFIQLEEFGGKLLPQLVVNILIGSSLQKKFSLSRVHRTKVKAFQDSLAQGWQTYGTPLLLQQFYIAPLQGSLLRSQPNLGQTMWS